MKNLLMDTANYFYYIFKDLLDFIRHRKMLLRT
jgi:hypothetical protein